ncbi:hemerythrin HHE cation-binding protein [Plectonema cf. radiosum LEGE 06105]|uniref:Hemerythrin HHE cation-binding protein n=1 Tax=Plectonema cf. radiosum LEGE 06105 TaxID=945769 RepID=A0A8J7F3S4_9CYAN|nr:hemerythrin HHE cation-binding protein [Plectonema radiosum]MBE9215766.1 hemerythrin HHE cation-binding protein [Plectonema cf. radiosum LEGE 06105]
MAATFTDTQRQAIAMKLADMKVLQNQMIASEQKLISAISNGEITKRLQDMLKDDQESLGTIEAAIAKFGTSSEPQEKVKSFTQTVDKMMGGSELQLYEKALQHEGMKHQLVMTGMLVHKCAQAAGGDWQEAIDPINKVNFKNRAHQEQLKGIIYALGTRELVGKEPDTSVWAAVEDGIAAAKGLFSGLTS